MAIRGTIYRNNPPFNDQLSVAAYHGGCWSRCFVSARKRKWVMWLKETPFLMHATLRDNNDLLLKERDQAFGYSMERDSHPRRKQTGSKEETKGKAKINRMDAPPSIYAQATISISMESRYDLAGYTYEMPSCSSPMKISKDFNIAILLSSFFFGRCVPSKTQSMKQFPTRPFDPNKGPTLPSLTFLD